MRGHTLNVTLVETMVADGTRPEIILMVADVAYPQAMKRALRRVGRPELADYFNKPTDQQKGLDLIEDVEFLLAHNTALGNIAPRLNTTTSSLARTLYRLNRPDLATKFWRDRPKATVEQLAVQAAAKRAKNRRAKLDKPIPYELTDEGMVA